MKPLDKCPHCGQPMRMRCGVRLRRTEIEIFDVIARHPGGVDMETLIAAVYPGKPRQKACNVVHTHICNINDRLVETDYRIRRKPRITGRFYLVTELTRAVA